VLSGGLRDRMRLAGVVAAQALARHAAAPYHIVKSQSIAPPERLRIAPPDIRTADPTVADEIRAGYFSFDGKTLHARGGSPFALTPPSPAWRRSLAGFSWLRHLRAADRGAGAADARALVADFLAIRRLPADDPAMEPAVVARRLLSFFAQSPSLLEGAEPEFYDAFMLSLARGARRLWRALGTGEAEAADRLLCAIALVDFAVCADSGRKIAPQATQMLAAELDRQVLSDGGHVSRNPRVAVDLLLDLLPLRQVLAARGLQTPPSILRACDRMMPTLRMLQHGDGSLALFNGMGVTELDRVANVLASEDTRGAPPLKAPYVGYQRLSARDALVLVDAGAPPPPEFARAAHAGCLSFEYSLGVERVVVNCGAPGPQQDDLRAFARSTAAHSTLTLGGVSSARIAPGKGPLPGRLVEGPTTVEVERRDAATGTILSLSHDGYAAAFGLRHARELTLAADGTNLSGCDRLIGAPGAPAARDVDFALRFHLHPRVRATTVEDRVEVELASGETLIFEAEGAVPEIAESIFLAAPGGARKCLQILLRGKAAPGTELRWSFQRV
jgi:uncharacterized heparinase superfamily protein